MTKNEASDNLVIVVGIAGIVILESIALYMGINGTYLSAAIGGICMIVGYAFGAKKPAS